MSLRLSAKVPASWLGRHPMNHHINSILDPIGEATHWAAQITPRDGLITVYGLGAGYHLKALLDISAPDCKIITYEPDPKRVSVLSPKHPHFADKRSIILTSWYEYKELFSKLDERYKSVAFATIPAYKSLHEDDYNTFCQSLRREMACLHGDMVTSLRFSYDWQNNVLKNLQHLKDSYPVARLFNQWKDKPFVILASGPSLDRDFHLLERLRGKAMTVAVGGLLPKLHRAFHGFPDYCMVFDGGWANYWGHFRGLDTKIPLIYDFITQHNVISEYPGPKVMMSVWPGDYMIKNHVDTEIGYLQIGPSIANTLLDFAIKVGANPIIFCGQDLAHIKGKAHASDTNLTENQQTVPQSKVVAKVKGVTGETIESNQSLLVFLHCLEATIAKHPEKTFINTSMEGAKIKGTIDMPLEQVIDEELGIDWSYEMAELKEKLFSPVPWNMSKFKEHLRRSRIYGERLLKRLETMENTKDVHDEIKNVDYAFFYFALQPAWDAIKCGRPVENIIAKAKKAVKFTLPIIEETYRKVA